MKHLHVCLWFLFLFLVLPAAAQTGEWVTVQALPALLTEDRSVQVELTTGESIRGRLESVSADALALNVKNGQRMYARQQIARVSVKKPGHRLRNA